MTKLTDPQQALLDGSLEAARRTFLEDGYLTPKIAFLKGGKIGLIGVGAFASDADKDRVAGLLGHLRRDCEAVTFAAEGWHSDYSDRPLPPHYVRPSQDPQRQEVLMVMLYVPGQPARLWWAAILRTGGSMPGLGEWRELEMNWGRAGRFV